MVSVVAKLGDHLRCNAVSFTSKLATREATPQEDVLICEINEIKRQIDIARRHFDLQLNFDLIDSDIYQLNALEAQFSYLIKKAKRDKTTAFSIT